MKVGTVGKSKLFKLNFISLILLTLMIAGCMAGSVSNLHKSCTELPEMDNGGRLSVFLNLEYPGVHHLKMNVSRVEILAGDSWIPISESLLEVDSKRLGKGQTFIGSRVISSGRFERLRITVSKVHKVVGEKSVNLQMEQSEVEVALSTPLELESQKSAVVLLSWDVASGLEANSRNPVVFRASHSQTIHVASNNAYVSCPDIDNIYIVRTDKNWVQGSLAISGRPTHLMADTVNKKLFVLAADESAIKIVDMVSLKVTDEIKIPMTRTPIFMTMSSDRLSAYILDDLGNLVKMDIRNGHMLARKRIGKLPVYALYLAGQEKVVVSSTLDRSLYFLNPDTLETVETISVSGIPSGLLEWENYLYIAETGTNRLSLYDLNERKLTKSIPVGYSPLRIVNRGDSIYLTNELDSSVSFLKGGQFFVNKTIPVTGTAGEMGVAEYHRLLYVANGGCDGNLAVIDLTSNRTIGKVDLGAKPLGIAVIQ